MSDSSEPSSVSSSEEDDSLLVGGSGADSCEVVEASLVRVGAEGFSTCCRERSRAPRSSSFVETPGCCVT